MNVSIYLCDDIHENSKCYYCKFNIPNNEIKSFIELVNEYHFFSKDDKEYIFDEAYYDEDGFMIFLKEFDDNDDDSQFENYPTEPLENIIGKFSKFL